MNVVKFEYGMLRATKCTFRLFAQIFFPVRMYPNFILPTMVSCLLSLQTETLIRIANKWKAGNNEDVL